MIFPKKMTKFVPMQTDTKYFEFDNTVDCPECLGIKTVYNGGKVKKCNLCKGKGNVNEDVNNCFIRNIENELFIS